VVIHTEDAIIIGDVQDLTIHAGVQTIGIGHIIMVSMLHKRGTLVECAI
jgi:hypothetical protein